MSRHMIIWEKNTRDKDDIQVFIKEPVHVVMFEREDLPLLSNIKQSEKAGIYILRDNDRNKVYVGQAKKIIERLKTHDREKDWWNSAIFFGHANNSLDQTQLNYLEKNLIQKFKNAHFDTDNVSPGNSGHINEYSEDIAESLWSTAEDVIENYAHVELFNKVSENGSSIRVSSAFLDLNPNPMRDAVSLIEGVVSTQENDTFRFVDSVGNVIDNKNCFRAYNDWLKQLSLNNDFMNKFIKMRDDKNYGIFFSAPDPNKSSDLYTQLSEDLYFFNRINGTEKIFFKVVKVCNVLKIKATVTKRANGVSEIVYSDEIDFRSKPLLSSKV